MKFIVTLIVLFIAGSCLAQDSVRVSGTILHPLSDTVQVVYNSNKIAYYPQKFTARLDRHGVFYMAIPVPASVYTSADIVHGNKSAELILYPGDDLRVSLDARHFDSSISYKGIGSDINNFIAKHNLQFGRTNTYINRLKGAINREPDDYLKQIENLRREEMAFFDRYRPGLPASFGRYWTAYFQYYNYFFIQQYPQMHEMQKRMRYTDSVPADNYRVLTGLHDSFSDSLLQLPPYLLYLTGIFDVKLKSSGFDYPGADITRKQWAQDSMYKLAYQLLPSKSAEYFIAQNLYGRARHQELSRTEDQLATFKMHWPQSEYLPFINREIELAKRLDKGQPAPDFDIVTSDGKRGRLSDMRGSVVYLSFWASWCRQCVGEMIGENKVKTLLKNKPVRFVYVSIGNDTALERKITERYKIEGTFTDVSGGWNADEVKQYGVQQLPAYFLIDQNGNFALQNAPPPANATELTVEIGKLLR